MDCYSGKTILITGATGLIGSHVVDALMRVDNVKVIAQSRNEQKLQKCFEVYRNCKNFRYVAMDISKGLPDIDEQIDFIFHAASPMERDIIANSPVDVILPNLVGTVNCLEYLVKQEKKSGFKGRVVLFSSVTVYGNNTLKDRIITEKDTNVTEYLEAIGAPYSQSKRMCEVIAQAYKRQYDVDFVIARLSTVYGNTTIKPKTAFFEFLKKAIDREDIELNTIGLARRDNIYIDDAVRGLLAICAKGISGESYNVSSGGKLGNFAAVDEIAEVITEQANNIYCDCNKIKVIFAGPSTNNVSRRPGLILDNTKLEDLGWELQTSLANGIKKTIESAKNE